MVCACPIFSKSRRWAHTPEKGTWLWTLQICIKKTWCPSQWYVPILDGHLSWDSPQMSENPHPALRVNIDKTCYKYRYRLNDKITPNQSTSCSTFPPSLEDRRLLLWLDHRATPQRAQGRWWRALTCRPPYHKPRSGTERWCYLQLWNVNHSSWGTNVPEKNSSV